MKILVLWASPNRDGLTAAAKDQVVSGIEKAGSQVEVVQLNNHDIRRCRPCGSSWGICKSRGACVIQDDFEVIYEKAAESDGVVFMTPVYWHDLSEPLIAFMDRLRRCEYGHNHYLKGKSGLLVACAGGTGYGATSCLDRMEESLKEHLEMQTFDRIQITQTNKPYMLPTLTNASEAFVHSLIAG